MTIGIQKCLLNVDFFRNKIMHMDVTVSVKLWVSLFYLFLDKAHH